MAVLCPDEFVRLSQWLYQELSRRARRWPDGEDLVQDTLEAIRKQLSQIDWDGTKEGILRLANRILSNLRSDQLQKIYKQREMKVRFQEDSELHQQDFWIEREQRVLLREFQRSCDPQIVAVARASYVGGYSYKELASTMGLSEEALKARVYRELRKFREKVRGGNE
ncbi:MAG: hypothetical protein HY268_11390 [Deltaproteobacteria bacterium]|nr:hypothetical protein [Deltaproteobacteria bacterium]